MPLLLLFNEKRQFQFCLNAILRECFDRIFCEEYEPRIPVIEVYNCESVQSAAARRIFHNESKNHPAGRHIQVSALVGIECACDSTVARSISVGVRSEELDDSRAKFVGDFLQIHQIA